MSNNPMDTITIKDREEEMGLSEGQKAALIASGLTKEEVNDIHKKRLAEAIEKEKKFLAKMEKKVGISAGLSDSLAKMLESEGKDNGEGEVGEPIYTNDELQRLLFAECKKNPEFTKANDDFYYTAIDLESKEDEIKAAASRLADIISPISRPFIERRWKGYIEEYRKYVENGEVGAPPDPFSGYYDLPIFNCYNHIT